MSTNTVLSDHTLTSQSLHQLRVFVAIVEHGSLTAAAGALGITKSVVSAHLRHLERQLGVRLLERTTRQMALTQVGEQVFEAAQRMVQAGQDALRAADAETQQVRGLLRVACGVDLASVLLPPVLIQLQQSHPELRVDAVVGDEVVDLIEARVDLAIRLGRPQDSSLILRRVCTTDEILVASPALATSLGPLDSPQDLGRVPWVEHARIPLNGAELQCSDGRRQPVPVHQTSLRSASTPLMRNLVRAGGGVMLMPQLLVQDELAQGSLVQLLPGWRRRQVELFVVMPSRSRSRRRAVFLEAVLEAAKALDQPLA